MALQVLIATFATAGPVFDTNTPLSFFTNVASRLLSSELNVNLSRMEVYPTNQYTPAVHRLLQVSANILDAQNTNFFPSIFRPLFSKDASNHLFIIGYEPVTNVSGASDPQLASAVSCGYLLAQLSRGQRNLLADRFGPVNVYGVPWIIGAKKELPNFNQLSLLTAATVVRKLEHDPHHFESQNGHLYDESGIHRLGDEPSWEVTFWNSYSNAITSAQYNGQPIQVVVSDTIANVHDQSVVWDSQNWGHAQRIFIQTSSSILGRARAGEATGRHRSPKRRNRIRLFHLTGHSFTKVRWSIITHPQL